MRTAQLFYPTIANPIKRTFPLNIKLLLFRLFFKVSYPGKNISAIKKIIIMAVIAITRPLKVILADDDDDDRELFREAVEETTSGVKLTMVKDGEELMNELTVADAKLPDIIFLDLNMPVKSGKECLEEIKNNEKLRHIPIIIYSTSSRREEIEETFKGGANLYISKPDSFNDLKRIAKKVFSLDWKDFANPSKEKFVFKY